MRQGSSFGGPCHAFLAVIHVDDPLPYDLAIAEGDGPCLAVVNAIGDEARHEPGMQGADVRKRGPDLPGWSFDEYFAMDVRHCLLLGLSIAQEASASGWSAGWRFRENGAG